MIMESKRKIQIGTTLGILIIVIALIGPTTDFITFGDTSNQRYITSEPEKESSFLKSIVVVDNQIPDLTIAIIFKNEGITPLSIKANWNLNRADINELLDSGTDMFFIEEKSNYTHLIFPTTDYVGVVNLTFIANEEYTFYLFETRRESIPTGTTHATSGDGGGGSSEEKGCYDGYTEYDPEGNITMTDERITFNRMHRDYEGAVYKDYGNGFFKQTFTHTFEFMITSGNQSFEGAFMTWSICDEISTYHDFRYGDDCNQSTKNDNHKGLSITVQPRDPLTTDGPRGFVNDWEVGTFEEFIIPEGDFYNKTIYVTVTRDNGFLVVIFYRDAARKDVINLTSIETGSKSYSMLQAFGARGANDCAPSFNDWAYVSGYIENLNLNS